MPSRLILLAALLLTAPTNLFGQSAPADGAAPKPPGARPDRPNRRQRPSERAPVDRDAGRLQRMVETAARTYGLDESQKNLVRKEIETMQKERLVAMGPDAERYNRLQQQVRSAMTEMPPGETRDQRRERLRALRDDPKIQDSRRQIREIDAKFPFRTQDVAKRIEAVLPPDQVAKAHAKTEERQRRWEERTRERERLRSEGRPAGDNRPTRGNPTSAPSTEKDRAAVQPRLTRPAPADLWEQYVRKFAADYELTPTQQNAAMAILHDQQTRAAQLEKANADRIAATNKIQDRAERKKRLAELNKPADQLFEELKTRLQTLLTTDQRAKSPPR